MTNQKRTLLLVSLAFELSVAQAIPVQFSAVDAPDVSGYLQVDNASFDGTAMQFVSNALLLDLDILVKGERFTLADVVAGSFVVNSSMTMPIIINGAGGLANNGTASIALYPDGSFGTPFDGDAALGFGPASGSVGNMFAVRWEASYAPVPEPSSFATLGLGLLCACFWRRASLRAGFQQAESGRRE